MTNTTRKIAKVLQRGARGTCLVALLSLFAATSATAVELALPGNARETARSSANPDSYALPIAPYANGELPALNTEGRVTRAAWRVGVHGITTLQLLKPLRDQLTAAGFDIVFECEAAKCGGFDFRFALKVFPEPDMHVDLYDYRFLSAVHDDGAKAGEQVGILVSRSQNAGFIQITFVTSAADEALTTSSDGKLATPLGKPGTPVANPAALPLVQQLGTRGHAVLSDLTFATGSSDLGEGNFASLAALAKWLNANPARRIALVGHTDAVGALDGNIALSKRRAASVRERLSGTLGVPRAQMEAEGIGYLAPIASNLTAEGRKQNRRVEAVLLSAE
ncbi:OmpA family protein [Aquicoccus sp. G2-2]|uniref:OmpA family protein n=1 Tax=Aquicoccus sp. G2-2 TaxID=3092120 RepID=UPI002ADFFE94|nr:OmpA family protein [Aquicoccus sp. G2-2]MEA1115112.1 OmpA family protein [Aquicoccus sp. G2-2]